MTGALFSGQRSGVRLLAGMLGLMALQGAAVVALAQRRPWMLALFVLAHGAASLGAARLWDLLPLRYRQPPTGDCSDKVSREAAGARPDRDREPSCDQGDRRRLWTRVMLIEVALFLPVLGLAGLMGAVLPALHRPRPRRPRTWLRVAVPAASVPAAPLAPRVESPAGASGPALPSVPDVLHSASASPGERVAALLALRALPTSVAAPLLRVALCDRCEDVRLLAYAMLDRRDAALQARIRAREQACEETHSDRAAAALHHHALAHLYWESAYTGLAQGAIKEQVLLRAADHARAAAQMSRIPDDAPETHPAALARCHASAWLLLGRIALARGAADEAETALTTARERGMAAATVAPFLAEAAFLRRDFAAVRAHLQGCARTGALAAVRGFWLSLPDDATGAAPAREAV